MGTSKMATAQVVEQTPFNPSGSRAQSVNERQRSSFRTPFFIMLFLLLGIAVALAHHFYYDSLKGRPVTETTQEWAVRIGTGLAVISKAFLVASAAISYQQHYWSILRSRSITVSGIDDVMGLLSNPACFFNWDLIRNAWSSVVIALTIWCLPLSSIVPPASLTAVNSVSHQMITAPVPTVNWTNVQFAGTGSRNSFSDAAPSTYRVVTASVFGGTILPMHASHPNYTYTLRFVGPRLRCEDVKDYSLFNQVKLDNSKEFEKVYYNATSPRPMFSVFNNTLPDETTYDIWFLTPTRNFTCQTWNVTYTADFSFVNGEQNIDVTDIQYDHRFNPVADLSVFDICTYGVCAYKGWYKAVAAMLTGDAYKAGAQLYLRANSPILQTALIGCPEMKEVALMSGIIQPSCPGSSLPDAIELLSQNATLSFFGSVPSVYTPENLFDDKGELSGLLAPNATTTSARLKISETHLVHSYKMRTLLISYSAAVFVTLVILLVGLYALYTNGISHRSSFSSILCTTRNKDLDGWVQGHSPGSGPMHKKIGNQKLQYGLLEFSSNSDSEGTVNGVTRHAAFGFPGTVTRLRKGDY